MSRRNKRLGEVLVEAGALTLAQLEEALAYAKNKNIIIGDAILELGFTDESTLFKGLEYILNVPYVDLSETAIDREAVSLIPESLAKKHIIIPIRREKNVLTLAMHDPVNFYAVDDVRNLTNMEVDLS